jgi:1,2-dihydroxy-3-keto-5-methylthiopentene dioxygenase
MALVTIEQSPVALTDPAAIKAHLATYGLEFDVWDLSSLDAALLDKPALSAEEKVQVLEALREPIAQAQQRAGYQSADVVTLSPQTPNLEGILEPFRKEHIHTENEIRLVIDGAGTFSINPQTAPVFHIHMQPGELISVPANTWHWFDLGPERRIKAVRIFESTEGWTAIYRDQQAISMAPATALAAPAATA